MRRTFNKFLILFAVLMILGGLYLYFSNGLKSEAALSSSLAQSSGMVNGNGDNKINSDISFISTLTSLNNINIDTSLFNNNGFKALNDNAVKLDPVTAGRSNPFAPISLNSFNSSPVVTNEPIDIGSKTAVFSGSVNNTDKVSTTYFEYGKTDTLGQKTSEATISLIGTFIANISGLDSKTEYFYKACARINGSTTCGDVTSFKTN